MESAPNEHTQGGSAARLAKVISSLVARIQLLEQRVILLEGGTPERRPMRPTSSVPPNTGPSLTSSLSSEPRLNQINAARNPTKSGASLIDDFGSGQEDLYARMAKRKGALAPP